MRSFFNILANFSVNRSYFALFLVSALVIGPTMVPVSWSGNEINYFDLAYRFARPDLFTDAHSIFDNSNARAPAFLLLGTIIDLMGFETAKTLFGFTNWGLYALSLAAVMWALRMKVAHCAIALLIFLFAQQGFLGGEWIFGTVEAKTLAYPIVLCSLAAAFKERWYLAVILAGAAAGLHFLVGGFWGMAIILLHLVGRPRFTESLKLFAVFAVFAAPVFIVLLSERIGTPLELNGIDLTLAEVYAVFRSPHHVAPFGGGLGEIWAWVQSVFYHLVIGAGFMVLAWQEDTPMDRRLYLWGGLVNLYIPLAYIVAFLDRDTHVFAALYLFRPASLILLMSLLLMARALMPGTIATGKPLIYPAILCLVLVVSGLGFVNQIAIMVLKFPPDQRLQAQLQDTEREVIAWVQTQTNPQDSILIEPKSGGSSLGTEGSAFQAGAERLTGRGMIVNFKFVPTNPNDLALWYHLIQTRNRLFAGDCSQLDTLRPQYIILRSAASAQKLTNCIEPLFENDGFIVAKAIR